MKQTYTAPTLIVGGRVVEGTLSGFQSGVEISQQSVKRSTAPGNLGFYL
jgi:hypothetical protein